MADPRSSTDMPWARRVPSSAPSKVRVAVPGGAAGTALATPVVDRLRALEVDVTVVLVEATGHDLHVDARDVHALRDSLRSGAADVAVVPFEVADLTPRDLECAAVPARLAAGNVAWIAPPVASSQPDSPGWASRARVFVASGSIDVRGHDDEPCSLSSADVVIAPAYLAAAWAASHRDMAWTGWPRTVLDPTRFVPRTGQGAAGLEIRRDDAPFATLATHVHDRDAYRAVSAELGAIAVLRDLDLDAVTAFGDVDGANVHLHVAWRCDGASRWRRTTVVHPSSEGVGFLARIDVEAACAERTASA